MATPTARKPGFGLTGAVGIVLSVLLLWWALRDVHWPEVRQHIAAARFWPFVATVVTATLAFPLRTVRWRYLLRLDGETIPFGPLWHATAIGFMANNVLPARTGELARAYATRHLTSVRFSTAAATIAVERIMDGITLVILLALAVAAGGFQGEVTIAGVPMVHIIMATSGLFVVLLAAAFLAILNQRLALAITERVAGVLLPARWRPRVLGVMHGLLEGLEALRSPQRFLAVAGWSFVVWGVNGLSFYLCMVTFDIAAPWTAALVVQSLIAFGVALPQSPGYFGMFEAATKATLLAYGISTSAAISYAVTYHISTFIPITLLGIWSLTRASLHFADLRTASADDEPEPSRA